MSLFLNMYQNIDIIPVIKECLATPGFALCILLCILILIPLNFVCVERRVSQLPISTH